MNKNGDDSLPLLLTNCTPTFCDERALLQCIEHAEPLEDPIRFGHERFADFAARLDIALQKQHAKAGVGHERGRRRAARAAADDDAIVFSLNFGIMDCIATETQRARRIELLA